MAADATQGPACALATAPALRFRNYFWPVKDGDPGLLLTLPVDKGGTALLRPRWQRADKRNSSRLTTPTGIAWQSCCGS